MLPRVVLMVLGGAISDRMARRRLMLLSDLAQAVAVGAIALLAATGRLELWHLVVLAAVVGAASAFFLPSFTAIVPEVLPEKLLVQGNALNSATRLLAAELIGPAVGGILLASVGSAWAFGADAVSFGVSVAALAAMRLRPAARLTTTSLVADIREGFRYTRSVRWLWVTLFAAAAGNFASAGPYIALVPLVVKEHLHAGPGGLGVVFAASGAGGGLAMLLIGQLGLPRRRITLMYVSWAAGGLFLAGLGLASTLPMAAVLAAAFGAGLEIGNLVWNTLLQELIPGRVLGRVSSLDWLLSLSLYPLSLAIAGPIAAAIGLTATLVGGGAVGTLISLGLLVPGVRDPERPGPPPSARANEGM
jgi:hypothetical protein